MLSVPGAKTSMPPPWAPAVLRETVLPERLRVTAPFMWMAPPLFPAWLPVKADLVIVAVLGVLISTAPPLPPARLLLKLLPLIDNGTLPPLTWTAPPTPPPVVALSVKTLSLIVT